jgi:hypothetical protein
MERLFGWQADDSPEAKLAKLEEVMPPVPETRSFAQPASRAYLMASVERERMP